MAAILFPVFAKVREKARQTACLSNSRQIGLGLAQYTQDYDETLIPGATPYTSTNPTVYWYDLLLPYTKSTQILACPSESGYVGYGWNFWYFGYHKDETWVPVFAVKLAQITSPSTAIVVGESEDTSARGIAADNKNHAFLYIPELYGDVNYAFTKRHNGGANYMYADGHVKWHSRDTVLAHPEYFHTTGT